MVRRCVLTALILGISIPGLFAETPAAPKIVFVCEHGSAKSVIAAKHLERLAKERGIEVQVISRGTVPDEQVPAGVRNGLAADGLDAGKLKPTLVKAEDLRGATRIISFGPDLSAVNEGKIAIEDWSATPSVSADYSVARSYIVKKIEALLDELAKSRH